jgi:U3 small nucleolar RNA-associated protein 22
LIHLNPELSTRYAQGVNADNEAWEAKTRYRNIQGGGLFGEDVKLGLDLVASFARDVQVSRARH